MKSIIVTTGSAFGFSNEFIGSMFRRFNILFYSKVREDQIIVGFAPEDEEKYKTWMERHGIFIEFN